MPSDTAHTHPTTASPVRVVIVDHGWAVVHAPPAAIPAVKAALECRERTFAPTGTGVAAGVRVVEFYQLDPRGRVVTRPGLVPRLAAALRARGWGVEVEDRRPPLSPDLAPDAAALAAAAGEERELMADLAAAEPRGQVRVGPGLADQARVIHAVLRLFPGRNVLVLTASRARARRLYGALRKFVGGDGEGCPRTRLALRGRACGPGCVVGTYALANATGHWHVVVLADASELANRVAVERVDPLLGGPRRVYALAAAGRARSSKEELAALYLAGPPIHHCRRPVAPVVTVMLAAPASAGTSAAGLCGLAYKRAAYWHNDARNDVVAAVARAVAGRDVYALWAYGLMLDESQDVLDRFGDRPRVVILVEGTEHGRALARRLRGWPLLSGGGGEAAKGRAITAAGPTGVVVTVTYAAAHGVAADVLIRADGGGGGLIVRDVPAAEAIPDNAASPDWRSFLIDFDDDFDARARDAARGRLAAYAAAGWGVPGRATYERGLVPPGRLPRTTGKTSTRGSRHGRSQPAPAHPLPAREERAARTDKGLASSAGISPGRRHGRETTDGKKPVKAADAADPGITNAKTRAGTISIAETDAIANTKTSDTTTAAAAAAAATAAASATTDTTLTAECPADAALITEPTDNTDTDISDTTDTNDNAETDDTDISDDTDDDTDIDDVSPSTASHSTSEAGTRIPSAVFQDHTPGLTTLPYPAPTRPGKARAGKPGRKGGPM